jgi:hypothetical protein
MAAAHLLPNLPVHRNCAKASAAERQVPHRPRNLGRNSANEAKTGEQRR